ncbi:pentapeptide repeat-containing protein [Actinomyces sp. oral taxon 414]|uniref:pentapeptide repeat-containing protein n=1 Tax=Actinomyces sp. oral taxon 414 TaxID=712122 RepID=UPI00155DD140|nr:pentapeptide repeat-containing protein [Actinomyces sp. oral taxon 414]
MTRRFGTWPLFGVILVWVVLALVVFTVLGWLWGEGPLWSWQRWLTNWRGASAGAGSLDLVKVSLTTIGGIGGTGYLVIKYRERASAERAERDAEQNRAEQRLLSGVQQLGSGSPQVRIAGVYSLADVADTYRGEYRQRVVSILCGYLRTQRGERRTIVNEQDGPEQSSEEKVYVSHDGAVESTVLEVLVRHLRKRCEKTKHREAVTQLVEDDQLWCDCTIDLHDAVLTEIADFRGATFNDANFRDATFNDANFQDATFNDANFQDATFNRANFWDATFTNNADFQGATFNRDAYFWRATFTNNAYFRDATFNDANFQDATFNRDANFRGATFNDANFWDATFNDANFQDATFNRANFQDATFNDANFRGATFNDADFWDATFNDANFQDATFTNGVANFWDATFNDANFQDATFTNGVANFRGTTFNDANFQDATFSRSAPPMDLPPEQVDEDGLPHGARWADADDEGPEAGSPDDAPA